MKVYLDSNAWDAVCDWAATRTPKSLRGPEYLFSSCVLDEFGLAPPRRSQELSAFAWRISNRKKLLDHLELTVEEIVAHQSNRDTDLYDASDRGFFPAWAAMRKGGMPEVVRQGVAAEMEAVKRDHREHLRAVRAVFKEFFRVLEEQGISKDWDSMLTELEIGTEIPAMLEAAVEQSGRAHYVSDRGAVAGLAYRQLPGTACWVQYYIALSYVATFDWGKTSRPDLGDQVDFRHAAYAGVCDVFVTGDAKMREILLTRVPSCTARVLAPAEYIEELVGARAL